MPLRIWFALGLIVLLFGCASPGWQMVKTENAQFSGERFFVQLPNGWMSYGEDSDGLLLSRDGVALQFITLNNAPHNEAFAPLDKVSSSSLLPSELAELTIRLLKTQQGMTSIEVFSNRPAEIAGQNGFRLQLGFENQQGLNYQGLLYGFAGTERFYLLSFYATEIHYFSRDLSVFEALVKSFRLI